VHAVGGDRRGLQDLGFATVLADPESGGGPLVGLVTGLRHTPTDLAVVLTCDMPEIDGATVVRLVHALAAEPDADGALPVTHGRRQVLTAAYRTSIADHLDRALARGERSVRRALAGLRVIELDGLDPRLLADLDRPEDVDHYDRTSRRRSPASEGPID
jgi:molybdopterin-guanine dinucleotide biosynthesis protein A